jgi:hypothetical protein
VAYVYENTVFQWKTQIKSIREADYRSQIDVILTWVAPAVPSAARIKHY